MSTERIHQAVSEDGPNIVARVHGQGPPLVLMHGAMADDELEWLEILPFLTEHFTCYAMSTRGRGLSGEYTDASRESRVRDVVTFVESIGEPVCLAGVSGGGMTVLGAAARTSVVRAVAVHEPVVLDVIGEELLEGFRHGLGRMREAAAQGKNAEAAEVFFRLIANDEEIAALSADPGALEAVASYLSVDLEEFQEAFDFQGPSPTAPSTLAAIEVPVLLTCGAKTALSWFKDSVAYAATHIPDVTMREVSSVGHLGHLVEPARIAEEFVPFLEAVSRPSSGNTLRDGRPDQGSTAGPERHASRW